MKKFHKKEEIKTIETDFKSRLPYYTMIAPFMILFFILVLVPIFTSCVLSLFEFDMVSVPKFSGFSNYFRMLFDDNVFINTLKNTLLFAIITGPAGFLLSFVLAWFLNEFRPSVRTLLSFMFYCPSLVGNAYYIWQIAFSNDSYGYMNSILLSAGFITEPINWLKDPRYVMPIIIAVSLWQGMGVSFLANISGLQNINSEMYEAGAIDGIRNRWQELWYITLPAMKHMLLFSAVMQIASAFSVSQIPIALAGYPSVSNSVDTIVSYLADAGTVRYEMGYASTISVFLFLIMLVTRLIIGKLINKVGK